MSQVNEWAKEHSLTPEELARFDWVISAYEVHGHDAQLEAELRNILAARKLAAMPPLTSAKIRRVKAIIERLGLNGPL